MLSALQWDGVFKTETNKQMKTQKQGQVTLPLPACGTCLFLPWLHPEPLAHPSPLLPLSHPGLPLLPPFGRLFLASGLWYTLFPCPRMFFLPSAQLDSSLPSVSALMSPLWRNLPWWSPEAITHSPPSAHSPFCLL